MKPHVAGYKSTEFWLALLAVIAGFALASGAVVEGSTAATVVGGVLSLLAGLGYTKGRTSLKVAEETSAAEASKIAGYAALAADKIEAFRLARDKAKLELAKAELTSSPTPAATPVVDDPSPDVAGDA